MQLTVAPAPGRGLSVRVRLAEGAAIPAQPFTIVLTLTQPGGRQASGMAIAASPETRDLAVELPVKNLKAGNYRLKGTLSAGEQVFDHARLEIELGAIEV